MNGKPQETDQGLDQKVSNRIRALPIGPMRTNVLPVYRANLNHPVKLAEHGNAASPVPACNRAGLTARRARGRSIGKTEEANASGNALDMPTSVRSILARELVEPSRQRESK